jgi:hypothetical protein
MIYDIETTADSRQMIPYNHDKVVNFGDMIEKPLMQSIFQQGALVYDNPTIAGMREHSLREQEQWRRIGAYDYGLELRLHQKRDRMIREARQKITFQKRGA